MPVKSLKDAEEIGLKEIKSKYPELIEDVEKGVATKTMKEYKTRKGREVFELKITKILKTTAKGKDIEIPQITIVTID
ncbi:unnamed protein product, partial [marine sediment metagenome]